MILTCPECQSEYRLDPAMLGTAGRTVRCHECHHTWFQNHVPPKDITDILADIPQEVAEPPAVETSEAPMDFEALMQQIVIADEPPPQSKIPDAVKPKPLDYSVPAPVTYKVMGMRPGQFGFLVFLMCVFVSSSLLFLLKGPLVRHFPVFSGPYKAMGFEVRAPGEGLRFSDFSAENRMGKGSRTLAVDAKLSNAATAAVPYPALRLTLKSAYGAVLQEWTLDAPKDKAVLASGESVPVKSEFADPPEGGTTVDIKVLGP